MRGALERCLGTLGCRWTVPTGGMFFWVELPEALDAMALLPRAVEAGVAFVPGAAFYSGVPRRNTLRLSFVTVEPRRIEAGIEALGGVLSEAIGTPTLLRRCPPWSTRAPLRGPGLCGGPAKPDPRKALGEAVSCGRCRTGRRRWRTDVSVTAPMNTTLDHLVVVAHDLDQGVAWAESTLGVVPAPGGKHPLMGTHNRLLALDDSDAYLEIIAIDPAAPPPGRARWFGMDELGEAVREAPRLVSFAARTTNLDMHRWGLIAAGFLPGTPFAAQRETPSGRCAGASQCPTTAVRWPAVRCRRSSSGRAAIRRPRCRAAASRSKA